MRHHAELVANRMQLEQRAAVLAQRLEQLAAEEANAGAALEEAEQHWHSLWAGAGIEAEEIDVMRSWHERFEALREVVARRRETEARLADLESEGRTRGAALRAALTDLGHNVEAPADDLPRLCAEASRVRDERMAQLAEYRERVKERQRRRAEQRRAETRLKEAQAAAAQWEADWESALAALQLPAALTPRQLRARLELRRRLLELVAEREEVSDQIEHRAGELQQFVDETATLAERIDGAPREGREQRIAPPAAVERVRGWATQLAEARQHAAERRRLGEELERAAEECSGLETELRRCQVVLENLCREAGCESPEALAEIERRAEQHRQWQTELHRVETRLMQLAQGDSWQALLADVDQHAEDALREELERLEEQLRSQEERLRELDQRVGSAQQLRDQMDGSGTAADVNQELESLEAKAQRLARRYFVLSLQSAALQQAIDKYREENQGPVLGRAEAIFRELTCGRYQALRTDVDERDRPILIGVLDEQSPQVPAHQMSEGTADALFLALRIASLEQSLSNREPLPFIVDDVLVQFDDHRCAAALRVLGALAKKTQVILFTHHQHLVELTAATLGADDYRLHTLA
jgi:uncharacterized protein YhaN